MKRLLHLRIPLPSPTIGQTVASVSILGMVGLGYLFGAAAMFYQWPSADFLDKCFAGARAWFDRGRSTFVLPPSGSVAKEPEGVLVDNAEKTCDGFTLYTMTDGTRAILIDMRGTVVHRWELPFWQAWPKAPHIAAPLADDRIHWFCCRLFANGDLLAIYHADGDTPYGYGLVKLDKDSKLLWRYAEHVHHDIEIGEDGTLYTLTQEIRTQPLAGMDKSLHVPLLADSLVVLSPEGRELERIPLLEAFRDSPYALMLASSTKQTAALDDDTPFLAASPSDSAASDDPIKKLPWRKDPLHANSVRVLPPALAAKFPLFKPNQILISLRNLDALAVVDRQSRSVAWASGGIWRSQHDAEFLSNGRLLVYDNFGAVAKGTRIVEYDPLTQAISWCYANENSRPFSAGMRGMKQRLPNGNTLLIDPNDRRMVEVTRSKEMVWENRCPSCPIPQDQRPRASVLTSARRYLPQELTFLKGVAGARP